MRHRYMRHDRILTMATVAVALLLAGCAMPGSKPHSWDSTYDYGTPAAAISTHANVTYYPACGNEVLTFEGRTWFQFKPMHPDAMPSDPLSTAPLPTTDPADAVQTAAYAGPVGAVVAPGPGDDVGTLVIYENDLAYWEADSGSLSRWLTNHQIEYGWVC